jgi:ribose transport system substrate-binding protein
MRTSRVTFALAVVLALVVGACSSGATTAPSAPTASAPAASATAPATATPAASAEPLSVAFFAASSQNGFNAAVYEGIQKAGAAQGVETTIFDGEFSAQVQLNQMEDAIASGRFDGFVLLANDTVGIALAVEEAYKAGIPTVTTLFPIGPNLQTLEKQVDGIVGTVARPPADGAKLEADAVVQFCADKDPCSVVILIGQLQYPFDKVRYDTFTSVLGEHQNIKIVATGEGNYDRDTSLKAMQDIIQANPKIDAILSNADQHLSGAEVALQDAGIDVEKLFLIGAGAAEDAVQAVRAGRWDATLADYTVSMGKKALEIVVKELKGEPHDTVINEDTFYPFGPILTTELLKEHPDFTGEWKG